LVMASVTLSLSAAVSFLSAIEQPLPLGGGCLYNPALRGLP
jgi:hypothetical protein